MYVFFSIALHGFLIAHEFEEAMSAADLAASVAPCCFKGTYRF